jgi:hypothetical protein
MSAAWFLIGAVAGLRIGLHAEGGLIAVISNVLAGIIVFQSVGLVLALFMDRARQSLLGAGCGALIGVLGQPICHASGPSDPISLCWVMGALIGATCGPCLQGFLGVAGVLYRLATAVLAQTAPSLTREARITRAPVRNSSA